VRLQISRPHTTPAKHFIAMKNTRLPLILLAALGLATSPAGVCATTPKASPDAAAEVSAAQWSDIKDHTYEMRPAFFIGLARLHAKLDLQFAELVARRATMKGITGTREWDFNMKQLESARSYLRSVGTELTKASRETWDQEKDKVGRAWVSTQDAYGKVKRSTTS